MSSSYAFCGIAVISLLFGSLLTQRGGSKWLESRKLDKLGLIADARIVRRYTWISRGPETYWVNVNFIPEGWERLTTAAEVSQDFLQAHEDPTTSHVNVRYLPGNPSVAVVEGERIFPLSVIFGPPLLILGLATGFTGLRKLWKEPFWATNYDGL